MSIENAARTLFPRSKVADYIPHLQEALAFAEINTPRRQAMFLGQIGIECMNFQRFEENLNYTNPARIVQVWPRRFRRPRFQGEATVRIFEDKLANADLFVRNPQLLANYVYANRGGNGNEASGDGWRYRGRGPKQITLRNNYVALALDKDFRSIIKLSPLEHPDLLLEPRFGMLAAAWFWKVNGLNSLADQWLHRAATIKINGGTTALRERSELADRALRLLT